MHTDLAKRLAELEMKTESLEKLDQLARVNSVCKPKTHAIVGLIRLKFLSVYRQFKHGSKPGRVTVPGKPSDDLALGTLHSILKQAQLK